MTRLPALRRVAVALLLCLVVGRVNAAGFDHGVWDALLKQHVMEVRGGVASEVDYAGLRQGRVRLRGYLDALGQVSVTTFDSWSQADQLAFLVNAYNAWTVELIVSSDRPVASIKDLGNFLQSPWRKRFAMLLGSERTLDEIEHSMIRGSGRHDDPRVHFAVNCASIGCPALRPEAYSGDRIEAQLEDATRRFLADRTRNRSEGGRLRVSRIFDWYRGDFAKGWRGHRSLEAFLAHYGDTLGLDASAQQALRQGQLKVGFLPYDWQLNDMRGAVPGG